MKITIKQKIVLILFITISTLLRVITPYSFKYQTNLFGYSFLALSNISDYYLIYSSVLELICYVLIYIFSDFIINLNWFNSNPLDFWPFFTAHYYSSLVNIMLFFLIFNIFLFIMRFCFKRNYLNRVSPTLFMTFFLYGVANFIFLFDIQTAKLEQIINLNLSKHNLITKTVNTTTMIDQLLSIKIADLNYESCRLLFFSYPSIITTYLAADMRMLQGMIYSSVWWLYWGNLQDVFKHFRIHNYMYVIFIICLLILGFSIYNDYLLLTELSYLLSISCVCYIISIGLFMIYSLIRVDILMFLLIIFLFSKLGGGIIVFLFFLGLFSPLIQTSKF